MVNRYKKWRFLFALLDLLPYNGHDKMVGQSYHVGSSFLKKFRKTVGNAAGCFFVALLDTEATARTWIDAATG